jgi:adenylylsulfate kinase-like enzyme
VIKDLQGNLQSGTVYWVTGLAGAGKSSISKILLNHLKGKGRVVTLLDGDELRGVWPNLGYSEEERKQGAMQNSRLCKLLSDQGFDVICATISLFHSVHEWNRKNISCYREIFLKVPHSILKDRDQKNLYSEASEGKIGNVYGIDIIAEEPLRPDLIIDNYGGISPEVAVNRIIAHFKEEVLGKGDDVNLQFESKAGTLEKVALKITKAKVLPLYRFSKADWKSDPDLVMKSFKETAWYVGQELIVRSSAYEEDTLESSKAGHFTSVLGVKGTEEIKRGIDTVIASFSDENDKDEVFIQAHLQDVAVSGVAFTCDPNNGGPYNVVNYDNTSENTDTVTGGVSNQLKTFYYYKFSEKVIDGFLGDIVSLLKELEILFGIHNIDIEFGVDKNGDLYLFQVRPLILTVKAHVKKSKQHYVALKDITKKIDDLNCCHPYLLGDRTILGVMPDWNPAEIVGIRPRPLALSLYRELVTDSTWAYQRDNYGYRNLRSFPLIVSLHGLPYVDVRVSFNSFIPKGIHTDLANRLVNYYLDLLESSPELHDKVEFDIIFSCYTFDLKERLEKLRGYNFDQGDCSHLEEALRALTNNIIDGNQGLWRTDCGKIKKLERLQKKLAESDLDHFMRLFWLIEDCKRYGTLPFAGLARTGFIAVQILNSLVTKNIFLPDDREAFMKSLNTVSNRMSKDFNTLDKEDFLKIYGHLRPGSYEITLPRYDESPDCYFSWDSSSERKKTNHEDLPFYRPSGSQMHQIEAMLVNNSIDHDADSLMEFMKTAIEAREYSKFVFTKSLSDILSLIYRSAKEYGLTREDCSYLDIQAMKKLYSASCDVKHILHEVVERGKQKFKLTQRINLPAVISSTDEVWSFHVPSFSPNFITQKKVTAPLRTIESPLGGLKGAILAIENADPGYDWIFSHGIAGFITKYGGINSHMAIRAGENQIPAVIGAGEVLYNQWIKAKRIYIDCSSQQVFPLNY